MSKLKDMRIRAHLMQMKLAEAIGMSFRVLQHYEQGTKNFNHARIDKIIKICVTLNGKLEDIFEDTEYIELVKKLPR